MILWDCTFISSKDTKIKNVYIKKIYFYMWSASWKLGKNNNMLSYSKKSLYIYLANAVIEISKDFSITQ